MATLTYADNVKGWVSFYSFDPDFMVGMNNYFYSFKGGNLYRHNTNSNRNTFYEDWCKRQNPSPPWFTPTRLISVFNQSPIENKLFKTIAIDGSDAWSGNLITDIQNSGSISESQFEKKEQTFYSFIRNTSSGELSIRSLQGIGVNSNRIDSGTTAVIYFPLDIDLTNITSDMNKIYWDNGGSATYGGNIIGIAIDKKNGINIVQVDTSDPTVVNPSPINDPVLYFFAPSSIAESHGVVGHYCRFSIQNSSAAGIELFTVSSEVMKSFP
jgi:hypothetical protein